MKIVALIGLCLGLIRPLGIETFWASQYAPGVMERVVAWHARHRPLPTSTVEPVGYIAVVDCDALGEIWWLRPASSSLSFMPFQVADCSGSISTTEWMLRNNIRVELEYKWAVAFKTVGRGLRMEILYEHNIESALRHNRHFGESGSEAVESCEDWRYDHRFTHCE